MKAVLLNVNDVVKHVDGGGSEAEGDERKERRGKGGWRSDHACEEDCQKGHDVLIPLPGAGDLDEGVHVQKRVQGV